VAIAPLFVASVASLSAEAQGSRTWTIGSAPLVVLGAKSSDSSHHLGVVAGAFMVGADGSVAIVDAGSGSIRMFASDARPTRAIGRSGGGPGEFRQLAWAGPCGQDGFAAYDLAQVRFTRFSFTGAVQAVKASPLGFVVLRPLSCLGDGSIIASFNQRVELPQRSGVVRATGILTRVHGDFGGADTLAEFPGSEQYFANEVGGYGEVPLGRVGMAASGTTIAVIAQSDSDWFAVYDLSSRGLRRHKLSAAAHEVTRGEFAQAVAATIEEQPTLEIRQLLTRVYDTVPRPTGNRYVRQVAVDSSDHIWVETFDSAPANKGAWRIFDRNGRRVAQVDLPEGARPLVITSDRIVLRLRDASGAERVEVFALRR
jgi:hypothetical protein